METTLFNSSIDIQCRPGQRSRYSHSLRTGRSADRIPVEARFSALVQTGPGAHPASCTMGTGSSPGVKWQGHGLDHPPQSRAEVKERLKLYLYSPSGPSSSVLGRILPLTLPLPTSNGTPLTNPLFCQRIRDNRMGTNDAISHEVMPKMERSGAKWPKAQMKMIYSHRIRTLFWRKTHIQNHVISQINICKNNTPSSTLTIGVKVPTDQTTQRHIHKLIIYKAICRYCNKITKIFFLF